MQDPQRRTVLKAVGAGTLFAVGGVGSASARPGKRQGASAGETITELAAGNDDFEVLVALLQSTGLDEVLDTNDDQYTVFAPTDDAFEGIGISLDDDGNLVVEEPAATVLQSVSVEEILLYHVTEGRRYSQSIVRAPRIEMLNGDDVAVDGTELNDGQANIVATDIEASNGVIHVIDGVLLP